jgi:hypothetical protein
VRPFFVSFLSAYFGELPLAAGGQGVPEADVPVEPWLPEVEGDDPEEPELPAFGVEPLPGIVPHGDPLGVVPGAVDVFGFTVEGWVLLPVVGDWVEFAPGTAEALLEFEVPVVGEVDPVGGFTEPVLGAVEPGVPD